MVQTVQRTSEEIIDDVHSRLLWDDRIDESGIDVNISDGKVVLTGRVPTCSDRSYAEEDVYSIAGVSFVDNRLAVSPPAGGEAPGDDDIASHIRNALEWSPHIDSGKVGVTVEGGAVTLQGTVDSLWQKTMAARIAENIRGVLDVRNLLKVDPARTVPDEEIACQILKAFENDALLDISLINVHVKDGIVTLSGTVHNHHALLTAEKIAEITSGVRDVNNYLVVI
ncbi:MAG: BON domain-containing protein [Desulfomonilia bacterium]|jgi:osmotically-inducible protein OsmY|uniref:Periplasmic protein n=1 Tax=anaerobic digester metagenome TaxID=1263854 RepID=A0A485M5A7_9ZZZZ|nr:BON domain-containing protein [Pseudomonadota bacterium]HON39122.1 BON domain-containing protein [Deltaproteobacteria bacterium]HRS56140.1 BON domain-containing protein [Desulfomonilia bacterium]HPD21183.1 BON domain-containing protein [Deltaproteobacteria bacterium]HPX18150.1 BON domain-containing protein [Deltaproteobacteria bacterium]